MKNPELTKKYWTNKYLNPTPESVVALRGKFRVGAAQRKRQAY